MSKRILISGCCVVLAGLMLPSITLGLGDRQVTLSDMKEMEYAWEVPLSLGFFGGGSVFPQKAKEKLSFIKFKGTIHRKMEVVYLDTPSGALKKKGLILRVRKDLVKPSKSKITLKSRSHVIDRVLYIAHNKSEIDVKNGRDKFSLAYDVKFNNSDLDMRTFTGADLLALLQKRNRKVHGEVLAALGESKGDLKRTPMVVMTRFRGDIVEGERTGIEVDLDVMAMAGSRRPFVAEFSFEGAHHRRKQHDKLAAYIDQRMKEAGIFVARTTSKTSLVMAKGLK